MRKLEFNEHNFNVLLEAYDELKVQYEERGASMRDTENIVRSLFTVYLRKIRDAVNASMRSEDIVVLIQNHLRELEKHTPL